MKYISFLYMLLISLMLLSTSCLASNKKDKNEKIKQINQLQLQEDIQRFYARFTSRIIESYTHDERLTKEHGLTLLKQYIVYDSEALKIATSPYPVANYLDMLVFIKLNRIVLEDYWIPKVYGKRGKPILDAFKESERDIEKIANKFIKSPDLTAITELVQEWRRQNPDYIRVSELRFSDFTKIGLVKQQKDKGFSLSGLIVDTEGAVEAVDEMVLVSNRALFLAQNIPPLMRLQMRLGLQEMITDSVSQLQASPKIATELEKTRPMVHDLTFLAQESNALVKDLHSLMTTVKKKPMKGVNVEKNLHQVDTILDKASNLVSTIHSGEKERKEAIGSLRKEIHNLLGLIVVAVIVCAFFICLFWWGGKYFYEKRREII